MTDYNSGQTDKYVGIREIYSARCETVGVSAGEAYQEMDLVIRGRIV